MNKNTLRFLLWFLLIWMGVNLLMPKGDKQTDEQFVFQTVKETYAQGTKVELQVHNRFPYDVTYETGCPGEPFDVSRNVNGVVEALSYEADIECTHETGLIAASQKVIVNYGAWNQELFWENGTYTIEGQFERVMGPTITEGGEGSEGAEIGTEVVISGPEAPIDAGQYKFSTTFEVKKRGVFSMITQKLFYQPIYNLLVLFMKVMPGHSLGLAIILLTILIRTALFVPTLHSLKSQRAMQELQPKLQAIREKHKDDQQRQAQETMALYKAHGVNPFGSCLPILIQMPFLFAVFYVLRSGLDPSNMYLLYGPLQNFDFHSVSTAFLTFDMTMPEPIMRAACDTGLTCFNLKSLVMPLLVGGLQALSSFLTVRSNKKPGAKAAKGDAAAMQQKTMNIMMMYMIPIMIAWFSFMYPAGLSMYWAMTTVFSIGQQMYLRRARSNEQPAVKVIEQK